MYKTSHSCLPYLICKVTCSVGELNKLCYQLRIHFHRQVDNEDNYGGLNKAKGFGAVFA